MHLPRHRLLFELEKRARKLGCEFRISRDFAELEKQTDAMGMSDKLTPQFSTKENTFTKTEALWIGVYRNDVCVGMVAMKMQRLGGESLIDYSRRYWKRTYKKDSITKFKLAGYQKDFMKNFTGNLVYSGEYRVRENAQHEGIGLILSGFAKLTCFIEWPDADYFYLYTKDHDTKDGLVALIGMTIQIENCLNWDVCPSQAEPYWFAAIGQFDLDDWARDQLYQTARRRNKG